MRNRQSAKTATAPRAAALALPVMLSFVLALAAAPAEASGRWLGRTDAPSAEGAGAGGLAGTAWQLLRFEGGDDRVLVAADPALYTLSFAADGRLSARISCNRGMGSWSEPEPGRLEFGPLALTRALCPPDPLEERLVRDWPHMRSYLLRDGRLHVSLVADGGIYEFEPLSAP
jgi:para-nitrobenzyl esterase